MVLGQSHQEISPISIAGKMVTSKWRCLLRKKTTKVSQWSVSVYGSIYVIRWLWKHIQTSRWVLYRVMDSNKGWARKKDAKYRRDKHTNTVWMMCMEHLYLWKCSWSIKNVYSKRLFEDNVNFHNNPWHNLLMCWKENINLQKFFMKRLIILRMER